MAPLGISFFFTSPAPLGNDVVAGGILNATQCHQPLPVGASGSYMVTAKLLVPLGAPLQLSAGEPLPPVQPKPLNTCSLAMVAPSLRSVLARLMLCAFAALEPNKLNPSAVTQTASFAITIPPLDRPGFCRLSADTSHSNFRDGAEAQDTVGERPRRSSQAF